MKQPDIAAPLAHVNLKLAALREPERTSPADCRIQRWLNEYLKDAPVQPVLPARTFVLDRPGLARVLSLPEDRDSFSSPWLDSYRVRQGVLHNPRSDRRTTQGVFHIAEGGLPIPADKQAVPKSVYARLLEAALNPPELLLTLPFTGPSETPAALFVSLLIRPLVCPATGVNAAKTMEMRFFAPGGLVSNLDFVESIFGNAGDPRLAANDAALDFEHWTGHTGCVILAPHLTGLTKAALGLPREQDATDRQRKDGMCWKKEDELYNGGNAFKICARDERGVMVTIIADNYFGYCKKEVKTQISYSANLYGGCEEEHAGGAVAFASYILGREFIAARAVSLRPTSFERALEILGDRAELKPAGYAIDRRFPDVIYVPQNAIFNLDEGKITWERNGAESKLALDASTTWVLPSGFRVRLEKQASGPAWRLTGTRPRGILCHKPCTVSGGGKSEISKSLANAILHGPVFVADYERDFDQVAEILSQDYSAIWKNRQPDHRMQRPVLSSERTLGSVIQLLTPSADYTEGHNAWIRGLSPITRQLVFTVKRYYRPEWGDVAGEFWRRHLTVDRVNGVPGHELKLDGQKLVSNYLRVGYEPNGSWRIYKLRPDFYPAEKVQMEDDITASVVVPASTLPDLDPEYGAQSVKLVANCETLLFQRPDDAIKPGADFQAEADLASPSTFISNFEPLSTEHVQRIVGHVVEFDRFTQPMKRLFQDFLAEANPGKFVVSSAQPRLVDGKPSKNPRYLQKRPDLVSPRATYLAEVATRLDREIPPDQPVHFPVNAVLGGRRNTLADPASGLPPLAVYGPIHYQELPELFMEYVSSLTGKSPSTVGFGSEGALTKGPFNAVSPIVDLNNALVSAILTDAAGFTTSAGYIGPRIRVDHDVSLLVPEIWCRMRVHERNPNFLRENGFLEKIADFTFEGQTVAASRLGYRITSLFVDRFLGRIFETPGAVFPAEVLRPEEQDLRLFVEGMNAIVNSQRSVAMNYFEDGSIEAACPPLKALLTIMATGSYEGKGAEDPSIRSLFTRSALLESDWYQERLRTKQARDVSLWERYSRELDSDEVRAQKDRVSSPEYLKELAGTIGASQI